MNMRVTEPRANSVVAVVIEGPDGSKDRFELAGPAAESEYAATDDGVPVGPNETQNRSRVGPDANNEAFKYYSLPV
jgi:hypothetical protein